MERKGEKEGGVGGKGSKVSAWSASYLSVKVTSYRPKIRIFTLLITYNN